MHLDPKEDMYDHFLIQVFENEGSRLRLRVSELHYTREQLPTKDKPFWLREMLLRYWRTLPLSICARLLLDANEAVPSTPANDADYQAFLKENPQFAEYAKWRGYCFGQWNQCSQKQYNEWKRLPHNERLWQHRTMIYDLNTFTYNGEQYWVYRTFERLERFYELAEYLIYTLEVLEEKRDKETDKNYAVLEMELAPELLFLVTSWEVGLEWRTEQALLLQE